MPVAYLLLAERQTNRAMDFPAIELWSRAVKMLHCTYTFRA
jgi:hypothetical protein